MHLRQRVAYERAVRSFMAVWLSLALFLERHLCKKTVEKSMKTNGAILHFCHFRNLNLVVHPRLIRRQRFKLTGKTKQKNPPQNTYKLIERIVDSSSENADLFIQGTHSSKLRHLEKEGIFKNN